MYPYVPWRQPTHNDMSNFQSSNHRNVQPNYFQLLGGLIPQPAIQNAPPYNYFRPQLSCFNRFNGPTHLNQNTHPSLNTRASSPQVMCNTSLTDRTMMWQYPMNGRGQQMFMNNNFNSFPNHPIPHRSSMQQGFQHVLSSNRVNSSHLMQPTSLQSQHTLNMSHLHSNSSSEEMIRERLERQKIDDREPYSSDMVNDREMTEWKDGGRQWRCDKKRKKLSESMKISLMSYNILSQSLLEDHTYLYYDCHEDALDWSYRGPALMKQFGYHKSDILCLQEMQENHWETFFQPQLKSLGYKGYFLKRTGDKPDGCAVLFRHKKFKLIKFVPVNFQRGGVLDRDNVGIIVLLKPRKRYYRGCVRQICVATTHLLFNPKRGDVKLAQLMLFLAEIEKYSYVDSDNRKCQAAAPDSNAGTSTSHPYCPIILCGDMNLEPSSSLFDFIVKGHLQYDECMSQDLSGQSEGKGRGYWFMGADLLPESLGINEHCQFLSSALNRISDVPCSNKTSNTREGESSQKENETDCETCDKNDKRTLMNTGHAFHDFNFKSVYPHHSNLVTTHHGRASCMVDYIFYSSGQTFHKHEKHNCESSRYKYDKYDGKKRKRTESTNSDKLKNSFSVPHKTSRSECEQIQSIRKDHKNQGQSLNIGIIQERTQPRDKDSSSQIVSNSIETTPDWGIPEPGEILSSDNLLQDDVPVSDSCSEMSSVVSRSSYADTDNSSVLDHNDKMENHSSRIHKSDDKGVPMQSLELLGYWSLLSSKDFRRQGSLPNFVFPSDHTCLIAKFLLN